MQFFAGQEVHGEAADFLAGVVRDWDDFAVLAFLCVNSVEPGVIFVPISKAGETC
ncbi:hypothetical protein D9M71_730100 [compost metagenome]